MKLMKRLSRQASLFNIACEQRRMQLPTQCQVVLQTNKRMVPYLFVRGDGVILVSPPLRS